MIGKTISHYRVLEKLGEGGMGVVFKAEDTKLKRTVALKFLHPRVLQGERSQARFIREARAAASLDHSSICHVYDFDEADGQTFLAMAYVEGHSLRELLAAGPLPLSDIVLHAIQVAEGLEAAHRQGVIHRDIKPSNVMITPEGQAKIMDFGLASMPEATKVTRSGTTVGTMAYMSPEQTRGAELDFRSDIWSLGVMLHELTTGQVPFGGDHDHAVAYAIQKRQPAPVVELRPDAPLELVWVIEKCLAKDPKDRYRDATELLRDLRMLRQKLVTGTGPRFPTWVLRNRTRMLLFAGALLVAAVVTTLTIMRPFDRGEGPLPLGKPMQVTGNVAWEGAPELSPDGSRIAFASNAAGNLDIYVIGSRGGNPLQLTDDPANDIDPSWLPDGSGLVFTSDRLGESSIWQVDQMGGGATLLIEEAEEPAVSPDGEQIAFAFTTASGYNRIFVAPLSDLTRSRQLTRTGDGPTTHEFPAWSPDGPLICYATEHDLWVVRPLAARPGA